MRAEHTKGTDGIDAGLRAPEQNSSPALGLLGVLALLTVATGLIDAVSYLGRGRVFVANMTGNVVFLGFAVGGARGFSVFAALVALAAFVSGAGVGGRLNVALGGQRRQWLCTAAATQTVLAGAATLARLVWGARAER